MNTSPFPFHSDSGDSLFFTQSVTATSKIQKQQASNSQASPFSQESEEEQETDQQEEDQHEETTARSDSDGETSYSDLLRKYRSLEWTDGKNSRKPRRRNQKAPSRIVLPFLKKFGSGQISTRKSHTIVVSMCKCQKSVI